MTEVVEKKDIAIRHTVTKTKLIKVDQVTEVVDYALHVRVTRAVALREQAMFITARVNKHRISINEQEQ